MQLPIASILLLGSFALPSPLALVPAPGPEPPLVLDDGELSRQSPPPDSERGPGDIPWPPDNVPDWLLDDLDPFFAFEAECPDLLILSNETDNQVAIYVNHDG